MTRPHQQPTTCSAVRESLSAQLDGETAIVDTTVLADHLVRCSACERFSEDIVGVARRTRLVAAHPVPDLTSAVMTSLATQPQRVWRRRTKDLRVLAGLAGVAQLILAVPMLVGLIGPDVHLGRDLGALQVALGVGLLFAAFQPRRASGVLPVMAVVAAITFVAAIADVATGVASLTTELTHLAELIGVAALWGLTRQDPQAGGRRTRREPALVESRMEPA